MRSIATIAFLAVGTVAACAFEKQVLTDKYYCDGINHGDINRDGKQDIVAGPFWYAGPDFKTAHAFYKPVVHPTAPSPSDSMFSFVEDFDGDGWDDILVLGRVHKHSAYWYQNPGEELAVGKVWKKHFVFERIRGESPTLVDIDGDGKKELICHWDNRWGWVAPDPSSPTKPWKFHAISTPWNYNQFYHGTGVGDLSGDGRPDLIINDGWWEQPEKPSPLWKFHKYKFGGKGGAQMFAYDVDDDGDNDVITSLDAHGWGLAWFERVGTEKQFKKHLIMDDREAQKTFGVAFSQPHALDLADIDGDGLKDIIVGKRRWAHGPKGDVEPNAAPVVYWFRLTRHKSADGGPRFTPYLIDDKSGVGVQVTAADIDGDGKTDVLSASKLGSFFFKNDHLGFVSVIGEVEKPRVVPLVQGMKLRDAIAQCGGWTDFADPKRVRLHRDAKTTHHDISENPTVSAGDIISVPAKIGVREFPQPEDK